ncbi:DUF6489 family protein [Maricaulis sp. CAU 1757]
MKMQIDIECSPEEARAFLGLPDVSTVNERLVDEMVRRVAANMDSLEPEALMKQWTTLGGQMTNQFMDLMRQASAPSGEKSQK